MKREHKMDTSGIIKVNGKEVSMFAGSTNSGLDYCTRCKGRPHAIETETKDMTAIQCSDCGEFGDFYSEFWKAGLEWNKDQRAKRAAMLSEK